MAGSTSRRAALPELVSEREFPQAYAERYALVLHLLNAIIRSATRRWARVKSPGIHRATSAGVEEG